MHTTVFNKNAGYHLTLVMGRLSGNVSTRVGEYLWSGEGSQTPSTALQALVQGHEQLGLGQSRQPLAHYLQHRQRLNTSCRHKHACADDS